MDVISFLCVPIGSSTVQIHDSLDSRRARPCSEASFSSQNDDCAWVCYRRAAFYCAFLCGQKDSLQRIFIRKFFLFTVESVCRVKRFRTGSINSLKDVRKSQMMPDQVRKWLRQQSKDFYGVGLDALLKRWNKCVNVCGGYVEKNVFFFRFESHIFYVLYPFVTYLLTLLYLGQVRQTANLWI
jgi:hypothetical protein